MKLNLVHKKDETSKECLAEDQNEALRDLANGSIDREVIETVNETIKCAHENEQWLECDCRSEEGRTPILIPCYLSNKKTYYLRSRPGNKFQHADNCIFYKAQVSCAPDVLWNKDRAPRQAPKGLFSVLEYTSKDSHVALGQSRATGGDTRQGSRRSAMSRLLSKIIEKAAQNRLRSEDGFEHNDDWRKELHESTRGIEIAPDQPLHDLWFYSVYSWKSGRIQKSVRKAAEKWPADHRPQGFLCLLVDRVYESGVGNRERDAYVEVMTKVGRPVIDGNPVKGPYLFLGVVGAPDNDDDKYQCIRGYAQPIVDKNYPIPVDSDCERKAALALIDKLKYLQTKFPDATFELEKPVFETDTPSGPCLPDFIITASGDDEQKFIIEVMGFERAGYWRGKEITHPRMKILGTLLTMQAKNFDKKDDLALEVKKVMKIICDNLGDRFPECRQS